MGTSLEGQIALVTGASRGIGYYTTLELAKAGAHVIACARTTSSLEALKNEIQKFSQKIDVLTLDLEDMEAIDNLNPYIKNHWGKLDILVVNAAILGPISPLVEVDAKSFSEVMTVNVISTWRLIKALEPLLVKSDCSSSIILSSGAAHKCRPYWGVYSASKAAVEALARTWAKETENTALKIITLDPGATRTTMRAQAMPKEDPATVKHPKEIAKVITSLVFSPKKVTGKLFSVQQNRFLD
ncbi:putative oxidoreductase protein [Liberibacter crescens BT-1]|uniref:Putative oxidoreductase protein n=1 Tax=Liberibacter crescens (strain BT-1) TaxID=1215343 RepID=L0ETX8_LIBCB|nr:SDR family NAD(P)-dependent oxidoreductase [Liberibacter crescens]AGA64305.1 putative oxidoreductase protein [Liberibacter crescens BT-1]AMC12519.1 oxidoreductase [Liberibacter crescens]